MTLSHRVHIKALFVITETDPFFIDSNYTLGLIYKCSVLHNWVILSVSRNNLISLFSVYTLTVLSS